MSLLSVEEDDVVAAADRWRAVVSYATDTEHANPRRDFDGHLGVMWARHSRYILGDDLYASSHAQNVRRHRKDNPAWAEFTDWLQAHRELVDTAAMVRHLKRKHGASVVLPLYLYDHSGLSITAGANLAGGTDATDAGHRGGRFAGDPQGWDTSYVGFVFDTEDARARCGTEPGQVEEALRAEVEEYDDYLTGQVFDVQVQERPADHDWHRYASSDELRCVQCGTEFSNGEFAAGECLAWEEVDAVHGCLGREHAESVARELLSEHTA